MSAKGRREGGSVEHDYYPTPAWCVDRLLDDCGFQLTHADATVLEPTVGDGAIVRAFCGWMARMGLVGAPEFTGVELRRNALSDDTRSLLSEHVEGLDFRTWVPRRRFDLAIGNPPFTIAESIIRHALAMSDRGAFLLRVGFMGAAERIPFFREQPNVALRVLPNRPSFDGEGTDSATYAWFVWNVPGVTGVRVLDETPVAIRNAQKPNGLHVDPRQPSLFDLPGAAE